MKKFLFPLITLLITGQTLLAQSLPAKVNTEAILKRVADRVLSHTSFQFVNKTTGQKYNSLKGLEPTADITAVSAYNKWGYPNGVMMTALMHLSQVLKDQRYEEYCRHNYQFIFDALPFFEKRYQMANTYTTKRRYTEYASLFRMGKLDDCGAMAAGLSEVYNVDARKDYKAYLDRAGNYILHKQLRLPDGTLCRPDPRENTIWADDLYMSVPFLARMGKITGNEKYFDDAILQVENFTRHLYDPATGLFFHCYYSANKENGVAHWGRANGWMAVAQTELIKNLPATNPKRKELISLLLKDIIHFSRWQDVSGLWHQVLDRNDSYLESSVTTMYVYAIAMAVNEGWIDQKYISVAKDGWSGLVKKITADGQVEDVCVGTGIEDNIRFYYNRPAKLNDTHGIGPVLLAGAEMLRYERNHHPG